MVKLVSLPSKLLVWLLLASLAIGLVPEPIAQTAFADEEAERFKNYEIRVIRPRFFQKRQRIELGAEFIVVMNDTFVYTLMASGLLSYHFSESWGLEAAVAVGQSIDRGEKEILFDDFNIKTEVFRTLYFGELSLMYTPIYGKVQLPEGRLLYFDTFLTLGGGMTGVEWRYSDFCQEPDRETDQKTADVPSDTVNTYPGIVYGIGQRIFRSAKTSLRWQLKAHTVFYNSGDSACDPNADGGGATTHNNITMQIGASQFF
jgi:outer membrane beta-barrel protein